MKQWICMMKKADFKGIARKFQINQVTARILRNRDVAEEEIGKYLRGGRDDLEDPWNLKGMEESVSIIKEKIAQKARIRIIGDYDVDGVCATYILVTGLERCGADVDMDIPDRIEDGYGINKRLIQQAHQDGIDTIITCDNGIAAVEQIRYAKSLGMAVVVTDHHDILYQDGEGGEREYILPPADGIINPKQPGCPYPYKYLCGAGVAFKFVECLYEACGPGRSAFDDFIEYAAIATVADIVELTGENRLIVREGLAALGRTENVGLKALINVIGLEGKNINSGHIGYRIGPCINACGRLDSAKRAFYLLRAGTLHEAFEMARVIRDINERRKSMQDMYVNQAVEQVEASMTGDTVLVVFLRDCHESLAGLVASKIKDRYYRPVFVVTGARNSLKGSGRSIEHYNMFDEMVKVQDVFLHIDGHPVFGGHPMAAGFSIEEENLETFRRRLNENAALTEEDLTEKVRIDVPMTIDYFTKELVEELELLEPFGKGNEKPLFAEKGLLVKRARICGDNRDVLKMTVENSSGTLREAVCFRGTEQLLALMEERYGAEQVQQMLRGRPCGMEMTFAYYPSVNRYQGQETLQIEVKDFC